MVLGLWVLLGLPLIFIGRFPNIFSAEKTTLQSQRQKLMNKSNVMERLGVSTTSGGKSPMTPGMYIFF